MATKFNHDLLVSHNFPGTTVTYTERDAAIYNLGIGACGRDAVDSDELRYAHHQNGLKFVQFPERMSSNIMLSGPSELVLPTFSSLFSLGNLQDGIKLPGFEYDPRLLLHAQQYIEIYEPLPSSATVDNKVNLAGLHDKGKAAILEIETKTYERESGKLLCLNRTTVFLRGAGGFSDSSKPYSYTNYSTKSAGTVKIPNVRPFVVFEDCTQPSQALLYRLSGDYNPLHSDPMLAKAAGFSRPILHGLCTLGFAVRAVIKCICKGDASTVKNISGKFLLHVYPGETLITEMWLEGLRVIFQTKVKERKRAVLSGYVELHRLTSSL